VHGAIESRKLVSLEDRESAAAILAL
jgi:hypothetical protein